MTSNTRRWLPLGYRSLTVVVPLILLGICGPTIVYAYREAFGLVELPHGFAIIVRALPIVFPLHMAASASALLLVPIALVTRSRPSLHRVIGRLSAGCILIGGLSGLLVAPEIGELTATKLAFIAQGMTWLMLVTFGVNAIWCGNVVLHSRLMTGVAIVTFGSVLLRFLLRYVVRDTFPFDQAYALLAWASWVVPLSLYGAGLWISLALRRRDDNTSDAADLSGAPAS